MPIIMDQLSVKTKVAQGGRIVLPAKLREAAGIKVGNDVTITLKDGSLQISTRERALQRVEEMMRPYIKPGTSVVDELLRERREDAANED